MTTNSTEQRSNLPWRARASFVPGKTRKQRQAQYRQQINVLIFVVLAALIGGGVFSLLNYNGVGATKSASCAEFPEFCVPLTGGAIGDNNYESLESAASRTLDESSTGAEGVVRYVDDVVGVYTPTIGNPNAPLHFVVTSDFACPHCQEFHQGDLKRFIEDYVLEGHATVAHMLLTGTGGAYSEVASQAALCAGEQGSFWEMGEELFRLGESRGVQTAFSLSQISSSADDMGLNASELVSCVNTRRYSPWLPQYTLFASDHGVTGTPTVLVSYGDSDEWTILPGRSYDYLASFVDLTVEQE